MSNEHLTWARGQATTKPVDKAVLMIIADQVRRNGQYRIKNKALCEQVGATRNTVRKSLDRLAKQGFLAFKAEVYRGQAQGAHTFVLLRNDEERQIAEQSGFSFCREALQRNGEAAAPTTKIFAASLTHTGTKLEPTLGQSVHPQRRNQITYQSKHPATSAEISNYSALTRETTELWEQFLALYPKDPLDPPAMAKKVFYALSISDQRAAVAGLRPYLQIRAERMFSSRNVFRLRWLNEKRWEGITHLLSRPSGELGIRIYEGTPECEAWTKALKIEGRTWFASQKDEEGRSYCLKLTRFPIEDP